MEDILRQVLVILRATWKHRRLGMLVAWVVGAIAAGVILRNAVLRRWCFSDAVCANDQ